MIEPSSDRRAPISPQLAVRVAGLGTVALVLFAIIFFRLWFLQVLSGDQFLAEATQNRVRKQPEPAPRGFIVDSAGNPLVQNRKATVVQLDVRQIPQSEREIASEYGDAKAKRARKKPQFRGTKPVLKPPPAELMPRLQRLQKVTGKSVREMQSLIVTSLYQEPFVPVILADDVKPDVAQYVSERKEDFLGITTPSVYLRDYPFKSVGAQLFGTLSEITTDQLKSPRYKGVKLGSVIGQNGLERTYDKYLRGQDGVRKIFVDAAGRPIGSTLARPGRQGFQLKTSIDTPLQKAGQQALAAAGGGKPGAFVALDPDNGEVLAMGSDPTFDPNDLVGTITEKKYNALFGPDSGAPLTNRAVSAQYSTGSTFKPVTAFAGLQSGSTTIDKTIDDTGRILLFPKEGEKGYRQNAMAEPFGPVDLTKALKVSSDIYFYLLGRDVFYSKDTRAIQSWAHKLGFGRLTGIDTGTEVQGVVPSTAWRDNLNKLEDACRKGTKTPSGKPKAKGAACGIADGTDRPYQAGDNVNLAIGQGDLQATPLQVALEYTAIANGGKIPTPHIGTQIEDDDGTLVQKLTPKPAARYVKLPAPALAAIREGLHAAASQEGGTSAQVFEGWDQGTYPVYGKTGTAQYAPPKPDQSWYAAFVKPTNGKKPLLVVATIEGGGFGAATAAPLVRQIFSEYYYKKLGAFKRSDNATR